MKNLILAAMLLAGVTACQSNQEIAASFTPRTAHENHLDMQAPGGFYGSTFMNVYQCDGIAEHASHPGPMMYGPQNQKLCPGDAGYAAALLIHNQAIASGECAVNCGGAKP